MAENASGVARRIEEAAYGLFCERGMRAVGVDLIAERAGVAKRTLYKHYPSKRQLALAVLRRREERWTRGWLQVELERRGKTPAGRLLAIFDVFDEWFRRRDFEGCPFIKAVLEHSEPAHPVRQAALGHLRQVGALLDRLARDCGVDEPRELAASWQTLMMGSIIAAHAGDASAARRAKKIAARLLTRP
jgi:AcrR family transcriptional regulator